MSLSVDGGEWQDGGVHQHSGHGFSQCCTHAHAPETQRHPAGLPSYSCQFSSFILLAYLFSIVLMYLTFYLLFSVEPQFGKALYKLTLINWLQNTTVLWSTYFSSLSVSILSFLCSKFVLPPLLFHFYLICFYIGLHTWIPQDQRQLLGHPGKGRLARVRQERHWVSSQSHHLMISS